MPLVNDLVGQFVQKKQKDFFDLDINVKANNDFTYLLSRSNIGHTINVKHLTLFTTTESYVADVAVIGASVKDKLVKFPKNIIHREDKAYIAVVLYNEQSIVDVFMFPVTDIKTKHGLFSIYKNIKKEDCYAIKIGKYKKFNQYKFGVVFNNYIK